MGELTPTYDADAVSLTNAWYDLAESMGVSSEFVAMLERRERALRDRIADDINAERVRMWRRQPGFSNLDGQWFIKCERIARGDD